MTVVMNRLEAHPKWREHMHVVPGGARMHGVEAMRVGLILECLRETAHEIDVRVVEQDTKVPLHKARVYVVWRDSLGHTEYYDTFPSLEAALLWAWENNFTRDEETADVPE